MIRKSCLVAALGVSLLAPSSPAIAQQSSHHAVKKKPPACRALKNYKGIQVWRNDGRSGLKTLPVHWARLVCSAAPYSSIVLSAMLIDDAKSESAGTIIRNLAWVAKNRHVHVHVIVQKTSYRDYPRNNLPSWAGLKKLLSFADLNSCYRSCESDSWDSNMHAKFMTVSHTIFKGKPALIEATSNISAQQFDRQRNDGIYVFNRPALNDAFVRAYKRMVACCNSANSARVDGAWVTKSLDPWTYIGRGLSYSFDPHPITVDPIAAELTHVTCKQGDTVSVVNANVTRGAILRELNRLNTEGCQVKMITEQRWRETPPKYGHRVETTHDKFVVIDAHYKRGALREVLSGSEDYRPHSMVLSDQQLIRVHNDKVTDTYKRWFKHLWSVSYPY